MKYRDKYKSVQINLSKTKHKDIIEWIEKMSEMDMRSVTSFIIKILKEKMDEKDNKA